MSSPSFKTLSQALKLGKIAVIPTDTIYGMVGSALNKNVVGKIYLLRKRSPEKPFIILISSLDDLNLFGIALSKRQKDLLQEIWPNPVSVILACPESKFQYLHRGTKTLAFRVPKNEDLLELLVRVGPLVAPSANFEGEKPAETLEEAKKYFGNSVDRYIDGGELKSESSTLIELTENSYKVIRPGAWSG